MVNADPASTAIADTRHDSDHVPVARPSSAANRPDKQGVRSAASPGRSTFIQGDYGRVTLKSTAQPLVRHAHGECHCTFKVGGGDSLFEVSGQRLVLGDDQAILVNPWEPHAKLASAGDATLSLTLLLNLHWLSEVLGRALSPRSKLFPHSTAPLTGDVRRQVSRLTMAMMQGLDGDEDPEPMLYELALALVSSYADPDYTRRCRSEERPMDARVAHAARMMREHAATNPDVARIATEVGLSRSRFFEQFRNCFGVSPQQYLDWERMTQAVRLLVEGRSTVAQVSGQLGFAAPSHFARFFSQHAGVAPRDFRQGLLRRPA